MVLHSRIIRLVTFRLTLHYSFTGLECTACKQSEPAWYLGSSHRSLLLCCVWCDMIEPNWFRNIYLHIWRSVSQQLTSLLSWETDVIISTPWDLYVSQSGVETLQCFVSVDTIVVIASVDVSFCPTRKVINRSTTLWPLVLSPQPAKFSFF